MSVSSKLQFAQLDELFLDPSNPRLGRHNIEQKLTQEEILEEMLDWSLDELALSFIESDGFWIQEALIVVEEKLYDKYVLVVVEGNRRLAALILLDRAFHKKEYENSKFEEIVKSSKLPKDLLTKIPYLVADNRSDVDSYLGFRHVTGIKEWEPAEKAQFIAKLIDQGLTYDEVRKKIGSKTPTVRELYISYKVLLQIEENVDIPEEKLEKRFSVLYLTLKKEGAHTYLNIDIQADPNGANKPVPKRHIKNLRNFALWLFGDGKKEPLFSDSRDATKFSKVLLNKEAVKYLETNDNPIFEQAVRIAGADEEEIVNLIQSAAYNVESALTRAHLHKSSKEMKRAIQLLFNHVEQLKITFPNEAKKTN